MIVAIGSDHGGYNAKQEIIKNIFLNEKRSYMDFGTRTDDSCDYPDFAKAVCDDVAAGKSHLGILICGTGIGMSMVANRNPLIRAGLCKDVETAKLTRQHNNANVLCLGARVTDINDMIDIVQAFLSTEFEAGRHQIRIDKF
jgi:ribose 5-phosphate isomerase B